MHLVLVTLLGLTAVYSVVCCGLIWGGVLLTGDAALGAAGLSAASALCWFFPTASELGVTVGGLILLGMVTPTVHALVYGVAIPVVAAFIGVLTLDED